MTSMIHVVAGHKNDCLLGHHKEFLVHMVLCKLLVNLYKYNVLLFCILGLPKSHSK